MTKSEKTVETSDNEIKETGEEDNFTEQKQKQEEKKIRRVKKEIGKLKTKIEEAWELRDLWLRQRHIETKDLEFRQIATDRAEKYRRIIITEEEKIKRIENDKENE